MSTLYLQSILNREAVDTSAFSPVRSVQTIIRPTLDRWAGNLIRNVSPSGSFAKGTTNRSGTDIDLFVSLDESTTATLKDIYTTLFNALRNEGFKPVRQNVSLNINISGYDVDIVPAKRQNAFFSDHSLYRSKADTWTKTNVDTHISTVVLAGRQEVIRVLKLWRNQKGFAFPSFYLELTVIESLRYAGIIDLSQAVVKSLEYLRDKFVSARVVDPANGNNVISDDLTLAEKQNIQRLAASVLPRSWSDLVI